jgi:hypothetical protein
LKLYRREGFQPMLRRVAFIRSIGPAARDGAPVD